MNARAFAILGLVCAAPALVDRVLADRAMVDRALAGPALANPAVVDQGLALFTGQVPGFDRNPCHACHGRDGRGGAEGAAPDLIASAGHLDGDGMRRALVQGVGLDGRALSRSMPRYRDVTAQQAQDLVTYLKTLPERDRTGVRADLIIIGVQATGPADPYPRALEAALAQGLPGGRIYGRRIELRSLGVTDSVGAEMLALIGAPDGPQINAAVQAGLPVLFSRRTLDGDEDASIQRGLSASFADIAAAVAGDIRAQQSGAGGIAVAGQVPRPLTEALGFEFPAPNGAPSAVLVGSEAVLPSEPGTARTAYLLPQALRTDPQIGRTLAAAGWQVVLVLDAPRLVDRMMRDGTGPDQAHASLAAQILLRALRGAGRDLGRAALVDALAKADLSDLGLDYRRNRLTGSAEVRLLPLDF